MMCQRRPTLGACGNDRASGPVKLQTHNAAQVVAVKHRMPGALASGRHPALGHDAGKGRPVYLHFFGGSPQADQVFRFHLSFLYRYCLPRQDWLAA
jgi:hypothetical protein